MAQFEFVRGLWILNSNMDEWTEQQKEINVNYTMGGQSNYLSNELCRMNEEARRQGYRRYHIGRNIYGYALYGNASDGRMSENVTTPDEIMAIAKAFEDKRPGFHFVDMGYELTEGMAAAEAIGAFFTKLAKQTEEGESVLPIVVVDSYAKAQTLDLTSVPAFALTGGTDSVADRSIYTIEKGARGWEIRQYILRTWTSVGTGLYPNDVNAGTFYVSTHTFETLPAAKGGATRYYGWRDKAKNAQTLGELLGAVLAKHADKIMKDEALQAARALGALFTGLATAPAMAPMAGGQEEEKGAGDKPAAPAPREITAEYAKGLATEIMERQTYLTPADRANLANFFATRVLKGSVTGYGTATVAWGRGERTGIWTWRQVAEQILVFTEEGAGETPAAQPPQITRARPLEYRGYLIHNETLQGTYNIHRDTDNGKVDGRNIQGMCYPSLDKAMAQVDGYVAQDAGGAPVIDPEKLAQVKVTREATRALIWGARPAGEETDHVALLEGALEEIGQRVPDFKLEAWAELVKQYATDLAKRFAGEEETAAQPTVEELTRAGAQVIAMAMKRGGQEAVTEAGRQGLARYFFKLHGMELISASRKAVMGRDSNAGPAKGAMWPEVIALVLAQDDEQKA